MTRGRILIPLAAMIVIACAQDDATPDAADTTAASNEAPAGITASNMHDVSSYELSLDAIDRVSQVQLGVARAASKMSDAELEQFKQETANDSNASVDDMVASVERSAVMKKAIADAGSTPREYVLTTVAMLQGSVAAAMMDMQPAMNRDSLAKEMGLNPGNIKFMKDNGPEIERRNAAVAEEIQRLVPEDQE